MPIRLQFVFLPHIFQFTEAIFTDSNRRKNKLLSLHFFPLFSSRHSLLWGLAKREHTYTHTQIVVMPTATSPSPDIFINFAFFSTFSPAAKVATFIVIAFFQLNCHYVSRWCYLNCEIMMCVASWFIFWSVVLVRHRLSLLLFFLYFIPKNSHCYQSSSFWFSWEAFSNWGKAKCWNVVTVTCWLDHSSKSLYFNQRFYFIYILFFVCLFVAWFYCFVIELCSAHREQRVVV